MVRSRALPLLLLLSACTRSHTTEAGFTYDALDGAAAEDLGSCAEQIEEAWLDGMPVDLACTGLYSDMAKGKLAKGVEAYEPAYKLWSDASEKHRWIKLPDGEKIDTSDMASWRLPIGTKVWKEFRAVDAKSTKAETRLYVKARDDKWNKTTYQWNKSQTTAKRIDKGEMMAINGTMYEVPNSRTCDQCHEGSKDLILGFEAVSLGLPEADTGGLTLQKLIDRDLLTDPPARTDYKIGDDGTGLAAGALGWIHINCGVTCHNAGVNSEAEVTGLRMKLDPALLDGRASNDFEVLKLLINQEAKTQQWQGQKRIVPGKPDESLLYNLITTRIGTDSNKQMPPLLTRVVDKEHAELIRSWILAMKPVDEATVAED